jgi:hypothetical protein
MSPPDAEERDKPKHHAAAHERQRARNVFAARRTAFAEYRPIFELAVVDGRPAKSSLLVLERNNICRM